MSNTELTEFEADLLTSISETVNKDFIAKHTVSEINKRKHDSPAGTINSKPKYLVSFRLNADDVNHLRATGKDWQTRLASFISKAIANGF